MVEDMAWLLEVAEASDELLSLLEEEAICLRERDAEKLSSLAEKKQSLVTRIEARFRSEQAVLERIAKRAVSDPAVDRLWRRVQAQLRRCRRLNESNGAMIALLQEHTRQSLDLLLGHRCRFLAYSADGASRLDTDKRLLGAG